MNECVGTLELGWRGLIFGGWYLEEECVLCAGAPSR